MKTVNVIEAVFFAALDKRDAGDRAAYLDHACQGDPDLRRCVEKLLAAQPKLGEFLQAPAPGLPPNTKEAAADRSTDERPGIVLGPYKLLHEIGEGGMGTVWMAEQSEPVKRRVALKVIKPGMDSRQILARFEAEQQALALMDHPNIAKVLDAGATAGGRPYFVMELVKGQPITEFCDKNLLTTRERLELFVAVCNALQHAHQKGVIHRDIKPSNVLVALYDGKPVPKVIDFGVAKAVGDPLTDKTLFTRHGQVVGTFEYMSPEQATLDQIDIDTRSDVYSLGVLLYELLTGTTPLDKDELRKGGLAEVLRRIREVEPPKPSTRLTSSPGLLATAAAYRKSDSQKLPRVVRGELDWIVMKALDKDRNRRFATANSLANDVERFLKDEPVQACPPTLAYRFRKWARKHKVAFATGSAIAAALLVGIALTSWQAVRATNAEHATAVEQERTKKALDNELGLREKLDVKLGEIRREQAQRRADQYAWDMQMLPLTWDDNNAVEARRTLERQIPKSDETDLRHFEWHFWNRQTHTEHAAFTLPDAEEPRGTGATLYRRIGGWFLSDDGSRAAYMDSQSTVDSLRRDIGRGTIKVWDVATRELLLKYTPAEDEAISRLLPPKMSRDGKVIRLAGTIPSKEKLDPDSVPEGSLPPRLPLWVRVFEVDTQKVLFDSRKEMPNSRVSAPGSISSDGRKLVTLESDKPVISSRNPADLDSGSRCKVWDLGAADRKPVTIEGESFWSLSPDGSRLFGTALVDRKQTAKVWDTATGKEVEGWEHLPAPTVPSFAFSPNGTLVATIEIDLPEPGKGEMPTKRLLKVYEANSGKELFAYDVGSNRFNGSAERTVLFSPDSSKIAVVKASQGDLGRPNGRPEWQILDARSGKVIATFDDPPNIRFARGNLRSPQLFSKDGTQFILAVDNVIHTLDTRTGRPVHTLRGCVNAIVDMVVLPDGKLRTFELGYAIRDWDLGRVEPVRTAIVEEPRQPVGPGGGFAPGFLQSVVSADGAWAAVFTRRTSDDGTVDTVRVWDAAGKGFVELTRPAPEWPASPAGVQPSPGMLHLSADGKRVALFHDGTWFGSGPGVKVEKIDPATLPPPEVIVWDVAGKKKKVIFQREFPRYHEDRMDKLVALSPDGTTLAIVRRTAGENGEKRKSTLTFVDLATRRDGKPIEVDGSVGEFSFSPDGKRLEGGFFTVQDGRVLAGNQIAVWDVATGSRICTIENVPPPPPGPLSRILQGQMQAFARAKCWSQDGTRLAIVGPGGAQLHLFDTATGKLAQSLDVSNRGGRITQASRGDVLAFSPDGRRIACMVGGRFGQSLMVNVIDAESGKVLLSLPISATVGPVIRFTPDGHKLLLFAPDSDFTSGGPSGAPPGRKSWLGVHTWDATPMPEPKQP